jgi:drug/metabolite transporter (DMT)-like permease
MYWLPVALLTALSLSTADALSKRALRKTDDLVVAWVREGYALPFLFAAFLWVPVPSLDSTFWLTVVSMLPLEIIALMLYIRAIRLSPLSLTVPFLALSPVFIVFFAFVLLGERPSSTGLAGIFLIAAGAYTLNSGAYRHGLLGPVRAAASEPGAVLMVIVALIYSVTSTLGKVAIQHSSPLFFGFFYPFILTVILTVMAAKRGKLTLVGSRPWAFLAIGFFTALMIICHYTALSLTNVAYMIAVKRTSLIWSVLYGRLLFGETNIRERLMGSAVMVAGVILISLF